SSLAALADAETTITPNVSASATAHDVTTDLVRMFALPAIEPFPAADPGSGLDQTHGLRAGAAIGSSESGRSREPCQLGPCSAVAGEPCRGGEPGRVLLEWSAGVPLLSCGFPPA